MLVKYQCLNCGWGEQVEAEPPISHTCRFLGGFNPDNILLPALNTRMVDGIEVITKYSKGEDMVSVDGGETWMTKVAFKQKFTRRVSGIAQDNGFDDLGVDGDYDGMEG